MNKSFMKGLIAGLVIMAVVAIGASSIGRFAKGSLGNNESDSVIESDRFAEKYDCIKSYIDTYYLDGDDIDEDDVLDGMYHGYVDSLGDKYADYYTAEEYTSFMEKSQGQYGGIGAYVSQDVNTGDVVIVNPFEGAPADKAGIKPGDIILEVAGTPVIGMDLNEVVTLMKGEEGTTVLVKVYRDEKELEIEITREIVDVPTVTHTILEEENIGYIYISTFDTVTTTQFREALEDIENQGAKGLIIDIRNNGGGMLDAVIDILDRLLPEGLIMYTETKNGRDQEYFSDAEEFYDKPLAILINGYSASASEVMAGAIQDYKLGSLIGTKSYGKGVVQTIFPLQGRSEEHTSELQ